ncbi:hypothetical protein AAE478_003485 [Parahypoxylon ruwenzoriense]
MRWWDAVILAACAGQTAAHVDLNDPRHGVPKLAGARRFLNEFRGRRRWEDRLQAPQNTETVETRGEQELEERGELDTRQSRNGRCGAGRGRCATGYCCSAEGWCGEGEGYCTSPDCQINYGPACDGNQKPDGKDTSSIARPKLGSVAYGGVGIYDCVNNGDIAVTFDDGPYEYTNDLLDKLARMAAEGHQIASHTWSHENFSQLTTAQFKNQMVWNEIALNDILGYFPTYMRPPYSICPAACQTQLANLGYHAVYFDLDTEGYLHDDAGQIQTSKEIWDDAVDGSSPCEDSYLEIEHDIHYQTVYNLTDYILESLFEHGYRSVTVGQCLGDPPENWYRAGTGEVPEYNFTIRAPTGTWSCLTATPTAPPTTTSTKPGTPTSTLEVSSDGRCGDGVTCAGSAYGDCCSTNSWCGGSIDYCGSNCRPEFGLCSNPDSGIPPDTPLPTRPGSGTPDDPLTTTKSGAAPTGTLEVSIEGNCGDGITCDGSEFGNCCSALV